MNPLLQVGGRGQQCPPASNLMKGERSNHERSISRISRKQKHGGAWKSKIAILDAEIEASPMGQTRCRAREELLIAQNSVAVATGNVQSLALRLYAETGDKTPSPDAKIALTTVLEYDLVDALDYAREHLPQALKLNIRTFEKAAKVLGLEFVAITQEPHVRISRDLSAYLCGEARSESEES